MERSINELLKIVRTELIDRRLLPNSKHFDGTGLCNILKELEYLNEITIDEYHILLFYLINNKPPIFYNEYYWYEPGLFQPRYDWLNTHIKLTSNE